MRKLILISSTLLILGGCAHSLRHGTVAMKESDTRAHVSLHDVSPGDNVILYRSVCTGRAKDGDGKSCIREKLAEGTVARVMNEHYSLVEFPSGTKFTEGDFVETANK